MNTAQDQLNTQGADLTIEDGPHLEGADRLPASSELTQEMYASASQAVSFLRAIGSEQRLMILCALIEGSKSVTEICQTLNARQSLVSQHLTRLRLDGLVNVERQGHFAIYSLEDPLVREIVGALHKRFCPQPKSPAAPQ